MAEGNKGRTVCSPQRTASLTDYYTLWYEALTLSSLLILRILLTVSFNHERRIFEGKKLYTNIFSTVVRGEALGTYQESLICIPIPSPLLKFSELFGTYFLSPSKYDPADISTGILRSLCLALCRMTSLFTKRMQDLISLTGWSNAKWYYHLHPLAQWSRCWRASLQLHSICFQIVASVQTKPLHIAFLNAKKTLWCIHTV